MTFLPNLQPLLRGNRGEVSCVVQSLAYTPMFTGTPTYLYNVQLAQFLLSMFIYYMIFPQLDFLQ